MNSRCYLVTTYNDAMWQRLTGRARKAIFYSQQEAQKFGEGYVSTEHLLLGLVRESDSVAGRVLEILGISLNRVKAEVEKQLPRGDRKRNDEMTLTPRAKRVIDLAYDEARKLNNNYIGTEHLLLGLIREGDGLAGRVLAKLGVDLERTRQAVIGLQASEPDGVGSLADFGEKDIRKHDEVCSREQSALVVIDIQDSFLAPIKNRDRVISRSSFIIEIAKLLQIPILVTEQYATRMGGTNERIRALLGETRAWDKMCFSCFRSPEFREEFSSLWKKQAVVVGIETHVCVNQTVHDFLANSTTPFVCADAVAARLPDAHEIALQRMRGVGAVITHTESVAYEWLEQAGTDEFKAALEIIKRYN